MDVIYEEIEKRVLEDIPQKILSRNVIIFSMFDGQKTVLYSIPIEPFFQTFQEDDVYKIHPYMNEITELCQQDIQEEVASSQYFKNTVINNFKDSIQTLLLPMTNQGGYTIVWDDADK